MSGEIARPLIRLGLDDAHRLTDPAATMNEMQTDEIARNGERAASIEIAREFASEYASGHGPRLCRYLSFPCHTPESVSTSNSAVASSRRVSTTRMNASEPKPSRK